ncbi:MAG: tetratricopeptide repeat protein [Cyanobacteria bacterium MAG IRC4_bin_6]|nr:tetratricopeptide repeat protein [Cyanobacteria bacterium MAG IRC4_bin_6]
MSQGFSDPEKSKKASKQKKNRKSNDVESKNIQQALTFMQQRSYKDAEIIYRSLIKKNLKNHVVNSLDALNNLGAALYQQGKLQEAIDYYKKALAIDPNFVNALSGLSAVLCKQGKLQKAVDCCKKALAIDPNFVNALSGLGAALIQLGEAQEAIYYCKKALAIDPNFVDALNNLGEG